MFEDGIVKVRQRGFDPETSMYCFGGGGGGNGGGSNTDNAYSNQQPGDNTRIDSLGNTVNFNTTPATVMSVPNYTKTLPNGVQVVDFSRPFEGQVNLSNRGTPEVTDLSTNLNRGLYDNLAVNLPNVNVPNVNDLTPQERSLMDAINTPMGNAVTPEQAMQQALGAGQFSAGRMGLGGGFYAGKTPSGVGLGFETRFAEGGPVTSGIGSLGLPQAMFKSTKF